MIEVAEYNYKSQHPQECKDPRRRRFCDSWPWPLIVWPQNKWTYRGTFVCQVRWLWLRRFFRYRTEKQTDTQWTKHRTLQLP